MAREALWVCVREVGKGCLITPSWSISLLDNVPAVFSWENVNNNQQRKQSITQYWQPRYTQDDDVTHIPRTWLHFIGCGSTLILGRVQKLPREIP